MSKPASKHVFPARRQDRIPCSTPVRRQPSTETSEGADRLDPMIHEQMRLGIVSALAVNDSLSFTDLKDLLKTTDGNLSVHARKLEEANYIHCTKSFAGRQPRTEFRLSALGRRALDHYLDRMEALIRSARTSRH